MDIVSSLPIRELGFTGLALLAVWMIFRGILIPQKWHDEVVAQLTAERDSERKAKEDALAANKELLMQNSLLIKKDDLAAAALASIHSLIEEHRA